jgi:CDP-diacylglycerol--serine O-phosphatidyltransferase
MTKSIIPNGLTMINLLMGCLAILFLMEGNFWAVLGCQIGSHVADFFDGWAARKLGVSGDMGKELDSLADMVSFGVVPGLILYKLLFLSLEEEDSLWSDYLPYIGWIITIASAYRLAKFNLLEGSKTDFIGLPTPANTIFFLGYYLSVFQANEELVKWLLNPFLLTLLGLLSAYLLNSSLRLMKLQLGPLKWKGMRRQWVLLGCSAIMIVIWREQSFAPIIVLYILISVSKYLSFGR